MNPPRQLSDFIAKSVSFSATCPGLKKNIKLTTEEKRKLIDNPSSEMTLEHQCELIDLARSSFYYVPWEWDETALEIMRDIDEEYTRRPFRGKRTMCDYLRDRGYNIGVKRTRTLMKWMGLEATVPGPLTSKPHPQHRKYPYLLRNLEITGPNHVWTSDITYIRLSRGFVYLTAVMDWYSRYVIAWELSTTLDNDFCVRCVEEALRENSPMIFNTDQGVQYTSENFVKTLENHSIQISMDGRGRAFDNIMIERLWRTVKYEEVYLKDYESVSECRRSLGEYFDFYNNARKHSKWDCVPSRKYQET